MKNVFSLMLAVASILCINSCSNEKEFEMIFPLGISLEEIINNESISDEKYRTKFISEDETKNDLTNLYEQPNTKSDDFYFGMTFNEDNLANINDLENLTTLYLRGYTKNGIFYERLILLFKNNKLVQVAGQIGDEDNATSKISLNLFYSKLQNFKKPKEKIFKRTYYHKDRDTYTVNINTDTIIVSQYKSGKVFFEIEKERINNYGDIFYTYYTKKFLPLCTH